ncbi:flavodoxin family protein [Hyphomonas sp. NPDC076900]|uniref:flavodoxin family protein n=1 Tax=unclassified Hyphomonas TaxID=2630699 RepID=UPI003D056C02
MKQLLIIWHSRTGTAEAMARAAFEGAQALAEGEEACRARLVPARAAQAEDLLAADGYLFAAPENLASLSGEMKEFFDRCYYPVLGRIEGRPYALMIAAGSDGDGAARQAARICKGWRLRDVQPPLIVNTRAQTAEEILAPKVLGEDVLAQCRELGAGMAAGIGSGIW